MTALLGAISLAIGIAIGIRQLLPNPTTPRMSAVFILDVSPAMQKSLGTSSRLDAAESNIWVRPDI